MKKRTLVLIIIALVIGLIFCKSNYRLTNKDISFNPYKIGDTLIFQSDQGDMDILIIASVNKNKLREKCYYWQCIWTYLSKGYWESYTVNSKTPDNHGEAWNNVLTIRAEPNGTKTIMLNFSVKGACWYGNDDIENDANKLLSLPSSTFDRGSRTFDDVIIVPSSNQEYRYRKDFVEKIYWSKLEGFVGFDMLDGVEWTVIKK